MTQANLPAIPGHLETGLDDFDPNEASIPRISLNHKEGTFKDNLTGTEFPLIHGVILGLVKQRTMFATEMPAEGTMKPQCKSNDAAVGYPTMEGHREELFPWRDAGINPADAPKDDKGRVTLPCDACPFSKWGANRKPPRCAERHTLPVLYSTDPSDGALVNAGIVSFQKSGIQPSKQYMSGFVRSKMPLYTAVTDIGLSRMKRGMVEYSVPHFKKVGETDPEAWEEFSAQYGALREFLRRPPRSDEDNVDPAKQHMAGGSAQAAHVAAQFEQPTMADPWAGSAPPNGGSVIDAVATPVPTQAPSVPIVQPFAGKPDDELPF